MLSEFFRQEFFENTIGDFCLFTAIIIAGIFFKRIISTILSKFLFRFFAKYSTGVGFDKFLSLLLKPVNLLILLIIFYIAFYMLKFPSQWHLAAKEVFGMRMVFFKAYQIAIVISVTWIFLRLINFFTLVLAHKAAQTDTKTDDQLIPFIKEALKVIVVILSIFFILGTVFNMNIASLIAGLGIGGLAIALAAKETLENLLGSFTIFIDKPFLLGNLVQVGNVTGHVEKIGFRSTRIRTLEKTYITVPNKKMVDAELNNLSLRTAYRNKFTVGLIYDTPSVTVKKIISEIKQTLNATSLIEPDATNVWFLEFGNSSLEISIEYVVNTMDWKTYAQIKEDINLKIMEIVQQAGSSFAYPSTTVFLKKEG